MGARTGSMTVQRLMCAMATVLVIGQALAPSPAGAGEARNGARGCLAVQPDDARLACYDREVRNLVAPNFSGRLSKTTDSFLIKEPTVLRYQSDGAILVLYLKASDNTVVQNLHIGGGGEDTYLIDRPGTYSLDVSGSESWRIWLEPQSDMKSN